jgi:hypothetical protein
MKTIKLTTPQHMHDDQTKTEFDASKISGISPVTGNEEERGMHFWLAGSFERKYCRESARQVRQMIDDTLNSEEMQLDAEAVGLLVRGVQSSDGAMHFIEGDGFLGVLVGDFKPEPFRGRERSRYEHIRDQLIRQGVIVPKAGGLYQVTQRGYVMGDHLAAGPPDKPFRGFLRLPSRTAGPSAPVTYNQNTYHQERSMNFNQTNNNIGDVNNAISEKGNVVQTTGASSTGDVTSAATEKGNIAQTSGTGNRVQVDQPKEGFFGLLWKKIKACWKWVSGG